MIKDSQDKVTRRNEKMFADNNDETSIERVTRAVEKTTSKLKNHQGPE